MVTIMIRFFSKRAKKAKVNNSPASLLHLDPLTPNGSIEGWAYSQRKSSLKGEKINLYTNQSVNKISGTIDRYRSDVADFKRTDGYNGFQIDPPSIDDLRLLLATDLKANIADSEAKIIFTDLELLTLQVRQKIGEKLPLPHLIDQFNLSPSTALYWHYLVTHELKREQAPTYLLELVYSANASLISSHRTRSEEIKLLLQYELYDDASKIYQRALHESSSRDEVEAFKIFKATYLGNQKQLNDSNDSSASQAIELNVKNDQIPDLTDIQSALAKVLDLNFYSQLRNIQFRDLNHAISDYVKQSNKGNIHAPNQSFDPLAFSSSQSVEVEHALTTLLNDQSLLMRPFAEFDTKFVHEYYCEPIGYKLHPYIYYLENPSIHVNPSQYFKSGIKGQKDGSPEYWNLSRANSHFANIFLPLDLKVSTEIKPAIHVMVPAFDPKTISAGFFGVFSTAKLLASLQDNYQVKLLFTDVFDFYPSLFEFTLSRTTGMEDLLEHVSYHFLQREGSHQAVFTPADKFVATVWYTASIGKNILSKLDSPHQLLYLIQDYEAGFYPRNSHFALAAATYDANYYALVSSQTLYEQLKLDKFISPEKSIFFNNACAAKEISKEAFLAAHASKSRKRLLFYGRPEVDRNMFELTILSLMLAYKEGVIDSNWDIFSIGLGSETIIELNNFVDSHTFVNTVPRMTLQEYEEFILSTDVCLTLMASPHPSLIPFDFAGIGSLVVTNSFQTKNQAYFDRFSDLIICQDPDPLALVSGLREAVKKSDDLEWRYNNSKVNYPRTWNDTWSDPVVSLLKRWCQH